MQEKGQLMLKSLIHRFHKGAPELLLQGLPESEAEAISQLQVSTKAITPTIFSAEVPLQNIHYSWLIPLFQTIPENERPYYLAALPEDYTVGLTKRLQIERPSFQLTAAAKRYLLSVLYSKSSFVDQIPQEFLPPSPFDDLLTLSKHEIVRLIDYLGIRDFAEELRHIVDKKKLQQLIHALSPHKQNYLKFCLNRKTRAPVSRLGLENWDGRKESLSRMVHKRGLKRLAQALSGQRPEFLDHFCQRLDIGRSQIIKKQWADKEIPKITMVLTTQVKRLIKSLTNTKS